MPTELTRGVPKAQRRAPDEERRTLSARRQDGTADTAEPADTTGTADDETTVGSRVADVLVDQAIEGAVDHDVDRQTTEPSSNPEGESEGDERGRISRFFVGLGIAGLVALLVGLTTFTLNLFEINRWLPCDFLWKDSCPIEQEIEVTGYSGEQELVELTNTGGDPVDLNRWEVSDTAGHTYQFMGFVLDPGASVVLHTGHGADTATDVYWNRDDFVWNDKDHVFVVDDDGDEVDSYVSR